MENVTQQRIALLHPKIRQQVSDLINKCDAVVCSNLEVRIVQGLRTIEEQNALYAQGRTAPGKIVTNAKGGSSFHNYGLAIDFAFLVDGKDISWDIQKDWDNDGVSDWKEVVNIFKTAGFSWGGEWHSIKDYPHLELTFGYTWQQLFLKYNKKDFITGTRYLNL